jgi:hypothetical protein
VQCFVKVLQFRSWASRELSFGRLQLYPISPTFSSHFGEDIDLDEDWT